MDTISFFFGYIVGCICVVGVVFGITYIKKIRRLKEKKSFLGLRQELREGHKGLVRANQTFKRINTLLMEVKNESLD